MGFVSRTWLTGYSVLIESGTRFPPVIQWITPSLIFCTVYEPCSKGSVINFKFFSLLIPRARSFTGMNEFTFKTLS